MIHRYQIVIPFFHNTLFDENAACHLAIGSAYAFNIQGGTEMTVEEKIASGLNDSNVHVDFHDW
ncbi:aminopeptidase [Staphylococcus aureus]